MSEFGVYRQIGLGSGDDRRVRNIEGIIQDFAFIARLALDLAMMEGFLNLRASEQNMAVIVRLALDLAMVDVFAMLEGLIWVLRSSPVCQCI